MKSAILFLFILTIGLVWGANILTFDFEGINGDENTVGSNSSAIGIESSSISRGSGLTGYPNNDRFSDHRKITYTN